MMRFRVLIDLIVRLNNWISGGAIISIMLLICADAASTRFLAYPIYGTTEIVEELTAILALFALAVSETEKGHLSISIISARLSQKWRDILVFFGYLLGFLVMSLLSWRTITTTIDFVVFNSTKEVTFYFPLWPSGVLLSMATLSFTALLLCQLIDKGFRLRSTPSNYEKAL